MLISFPATTWRSNIVIIVLISKNYFAFVPCKSFNLIKKPIRLSILLRANDKKINILFLRMARLTEIPSSIRSTCHFNGIWSVIVSLEDELREIISMIWNFYISVVNFVISFAAVNIEGVSFKSTHFIDNLIIESFIKLRHWLNIWVNKNSFNLEISKLLDYKYYWVIKNVLSDVENVG